MYKTVGRGFSIAYEIRENSYPQDVLFIHGNLASKEWWLPSMELLARRRGDKKMVAADWRGYGDSLGISSADEINFEVFADDMIALAESLEMSKVQVVGHSTGGLIAMLATLKKPELFSGLILLDSVGPTGLKLDLPKEQVLAHFQQMADNKEYCRTVLAATIKDMEPEDPRFQPLIEKTWNADKVMFQGVIDVLSSGLDYTKTFASIEIPTLVLHGDQDVVLPLSMSEQIVATLKKAQLKVMDNQGHSMNMENPGRFAKECEAFWLR